jgi:hypothetical protein
MRTTACPHFRRQIIRNFQNQLHQSLLGGTQLCNNLALLRISACFCYEPIFKKGVEHHAFLPKQCLCEFRSTS